MSPEVEARPRTLEPKKHCTFSPREKVLFFNLFVGARGTIAASPEKVETPTLRITGSAGLKEI